MLASDLPPDVLIEVAESILLPRQFRAWYLRFTTPATVYGVTKQLQEEGYKGYRKRPVSLRTVQSDLKDANEAIDQHLSALEDDEEGVRAFAVVVCQAGTTRLATDATPKSAHEALGFGMLLRPKARAA